MAKTNTKTNSKKTATRTRVTTGRAGARPVGGASVRMYRQGLGDCFLLTFPRAEDGPFHVLIDCGVILGTKDPGGIMEKVAQDIAETTGKHLHLLVATHEHWDHLSGFIQAQEVFDDIQIDEVWFAWTEDPADGLAGRLRAGHERALKGLRALGQKLAARGVNGPAADRLHGLAERVDGLLEFFGAAGRKGTRDALNYLARHPSAPRVRFRRPGEAPVALPGVGGVRVFVLGPPHDEKLIKRSNPTKKGQEVYELALDADGAFLAAAGGLDDGDAELIEMSQAFEAHHRIKLEDAEKNDFFRQYCGSAADPGQAWRRIDDDWLEVGDQLALSLDSDTNNTSLVLAFELEPGGRVLLFPGDAQVGNWLSWHELDKSGPGKEGDFARDLLARTVLYKVGHHASHNATLRDKGLELMASPDLVALIPVDHAMAVKKRWPGMPFPSLLARLQEKTQGRVLRIDEGIPAKPAGVPAGLWDEFRRRVTEHELYFEYTLNP